MENKCNQHDGVREDIILLKEKTKAQGIAIDKLEEKLESIQKTVQSIDKHVSSMPTKIIVIILGSGGLTLLIQKILGG